MLASSFLDSREINPEMMVIDQTYGRYSREQPGSANPGVEVRLDRGAVFVDCHENGKLRQPPEECAQTFTEQELAEGVHVCALVSNFGDGVYYAGKIWLNTECSLAPPDPSSLSAEGITLGTPYLVQISWDMHELIVPQETSMGVLSFISSSYEKDRPQNVGYRRVYQDGRAKIR